MLKLNALQIPTQQLDGSPQNPPYGDASVFRNRDGVLLNELIRPRQRPVTNVVAIIVIAVTFIPILCAYYFTRENDEQKN